MTTTTRPGASALWIALLTITSIATTFLLACATPFASLAAVAALHMRQRDGMILMVLTWIASQAVGFGLLHYPHTASTYAWGFGLGSAAIAALLGAELLLPRFHGAPLAARMAITFVAAFAAFKLVLLGWSLVLGGVHTAIAPAFAAKQFVREAAIFVGLYLVSRALVSLGVPAPRMPLSAR